MNVINGDYVKGATVECEEHTHVMWEICVGLSGTSVSDVAGREYEVGPQDFMIIPPEIPHYRKRVSNYNYINLRASTLDFQGFLMGHDWDNHMSVLIKMIYKELLKKEKNYMYICDSLLDTICQYVNKYIETDYKFKFVADLKDIIYKNLSNVDFSVADAMKNIGFDDDYVRRCFKTDVGVTPLEYLTKLRIERAKRILYNEVTIPISEVALKCGYTDSLYFSKVFKKYMGISPKKFSNECK